jgi:anti-sigma regulatory factor (Ser/Thr protein kinase)
MEARGHIRDTLDAWALTPLCDAALLLTSEVVTNALLHARTQITLFAERLGADGVRISVADGSPVAPSLRRHSGTATTGRGLQLLGQLADAWDTDLTLDGKTVWFTLRGDRDPWAGFRDIDWVEDGRH